VTIVITHTGHPTT